MIVALGANGGAIGYFLDDQLGADPLTAMRNTYGCPADSYQQIADASHAEAMMQAANGVDMYWDEGALIPRPTIAAVVGESIAGDGSQTHTVTGLPDGAAVSVNGASAGTISAGSFSMVADTPGLYQVTVSLWPYMPLTYTVEAT